MQKLKDPKVIAVVVGVILAIAMSMFAPVKEVAVDVCRKIVAENPAESAPAPVDDLK